MAAKSSVKIKERLQKIQDDEEVYNVTFNNRETTYN